MLSEPKNPPLKEQISNFPFDFVPEHHRHRSRQKFPRRQAAGVAAYNGGMEDNKQVTSDAAVLVKGAIKTEYNFVEFDRTNF